MNEDRNIRAVLDRHWAASDANDFEAEHEIYHDSVVLEYPQSEEHDLGYRSIASRVRYTALATDACWRSACEEFVHVRGL